MALILLTALLILILPGRYILLKKRFLSVQKTPPVPPLPAQGGEEEEFVRRLAELIRIPTVSRTDRSKRRPKVFRRFQEELIRLFPLVHARLEREVHGDFGLIYRWAGEDPRKKPVLFLAHYDVVPAGEEAGEHWRQDPFGGEIIGGELWGRGTLDIKTQLAFQLETAERLLQQGWTPQRDIYFAFGGDEEISGTEGAQKLAGVFRERGLAFEFILDEGGIIARDQLSFLKGRPAALIGLAEKGFVTFRITAPGETGHSSMPDREGTAVGRLARGVVRLEKRRFPSRLEPVTRRMLEQLVPWVSPPLGLVFANLWLTAPLIRLALGGSRQTDSLIRTTQAVTVFRAGEQENVLPGEASCLVNHRIRPGDTIQKIRRRHRRVLKDRGLSIEDAGNWPSNDPIVPEDPEGSGFQLIRSILEETHPEAVAAPFLVNGSTDSKYYKDLTSQILRFTPLVLSPEDVASIHGANERVSLENLQRGMMFYTALFRRL